MNNQLNGLLTFIIQLKQEVRHSLKFSHSLFLVMKDSPTGLLILRKVLHNKQLHSHNPFHSASNKELVLIFAHKTPTIPDPFKEEVSLQGLLRFSRYARLLLRNCSAQSVSFRAGILPSFRSGNPAVGFYRLKYASKLLQQLQVFPPFLTSQTARFSKDFPSNQKGLNSFLNRLIIKA